jgi:hypothetical protein
MKYCILTPTFSGHFQFLPKYLDKHEGEICFIINASENVGLQKIISKFKDLNIRVIFFENLLREFGIPWDPGHLLHHYGKFTFQSLKKILGMLHLKEYRYFGVFDSETMWMRPVSMATMIEDFFKDPYIFYSHVNQRKITGRSNTEASAGINFLLKMDCQYWFVEQFVRFWDVQVFKDIQAAHGSYYDLAQDLKIWETSQGYSQGIFESMLYDQWVLYHLDTYGYRAIDLDAEFEKFLPTDVREDYYTRFEHTYRGRCGLTENICPLLTPSNRDYIVQMFKSWNIQVLRIEDSTASYFKECKFFYEALQPIMITCSQQHNFGLSEGSYPHLRWEALAKNPKLRKVSRDLKGFFKPFWLFVIWAILPIRFICSLYSYVKRAINIIRKKIDL